MDRKHKAGACKANPFNVGLYLYANNTQEEEEEEPPSFSFHLFFGTSGPFIFTALHDKTLGYAKRKKKTEKKASKEFFLFLSSIYMVQSPIIYT
jgi:hypothetical protein